MQKGFYYILLFCLISVAFSCNNNKGYVYVTGETHSGVVIESIKIIKPDEKQSEKENIIREECKVISSNGYNWYVFEVPEGTWDVYIEYFDNDEFNNVREEVFVKNTNKKNYWVAVWLVDNYNYKVWKEFGSGEFVITSSEF